MYPEATERKRVRSEVSIVLDLDVVDGESKKSYKFKLGESQETHFKFSTRTWIGNHPDGSPVFKIVFDIPSEGTNSNEKIGYVVGDPFSSEIRNTPGDYTVPRLSFSDSLLKTE